MFPVLRKISHLFDLPKYTFGVDIIKKKEYFFTNGDFK